MQHSLQRLHTDLDRHSPGGDGHHRALGTMLVATQDLLDYEAGVPAARAAAHAVARRMQERSRLLAIAGGLGAAAALVIVLAGVGVAGTAAMVAAVGGLLTAGLVAGGSSSLVEEPLGWRRATVATAVVVVAMVVGGALWWPATGLVVLAVGLCLQPWLPDVVNAEAAAE
jgi:hypothetical protein